MKTSIEIKEEETSFTFSQMIKREGVYYDPDFNDGYVFVSTRNHVIRLDTSSNSIEILGEDNALYMNDKSTLYTEKKCTVTLTFN